MNNHHSVIASPKGEAIPDAMLEIASLSLAMTGGELLWY